MTYKVSSWMLSLYSLTCYERWSPIICWTAVLMSETSVLHSVKQACGCLAGKVFSTFTSFEIHHSIVPIGLGITELPEI